jgi:hypothetical protein
MAADDARQAAEAAKFRQKLDTMVAAAADAKKYDAARAQVLATTALLEEERAAAALAEKARVAAALIEPPSPMPTPPPAPAGHAAPSDDDYEATVIANIHVQAVDVFVLSSRSRWTSPHPRTMPGGMTTSCSPSAVTLSPTTCSWTPRTSAFQLGTGWTASSSHGSGARPPSRCMAGTGEPLPRQPRNPRPPHQRHLPELRLGQPLHGGYQDSILEDSILEQHLDICLAALASYKYVTQSL